MARPAEKARAMLNKWVAMREAGNETHKPRHNRRPHLASACEHLADAERFRNQIVREISVLLEKLQNPAADEHDLREWNDDVNHKTREKFHWNKRIYELGGVDYNALERKRQLEQGVEPTTSAYRYYGAAKDLPGVKEFLEQQALQKQKQVHKKRIDHDLTPDYFGWRDEEDGILLEMEALVTKQQQKRYGKSAAPDDEEMAVATTSAEDYLGVATPDQVSAMLLESKKKSLISMYGL